MPDREPDVYERLTELFVKSSVSYRVMRHAPEGRTDVASRLRSHPLEQAAKSIVTRVATGRRSRRYVLAVVPGHRRVDLDALAGQYGGREASFAVREIAERLSGSVSGAIAPFSFSADLEVLVDNGLLEHEEIYFNAGRLDLSVALPIAGYLDLVRPTVASIAV